MRSFRPAALRVPTRSRTTTWPAPWMWRWPPSRPQALTQRAKKTRPTTQGSLRIGYRHPLLPNPRSPQPRQRVGRVEVEGQMLAHGAWRGRWHRASGNSGGPAGGQSPAGPSSVLHLEGLAEEILDQGAVRGVGLATRHGDTLSMRLTFAPSASPAWAGRGGGIRGTVYPTATSWP